MDRRFFAYAAAVFTSLVCIVGYSQTVANQGKPGTQGPWPVTSTGSDGGAVIIQPVRCTGTGAQKITTVGVAAGNTPSTQLATRVYLELCNSLQNSGNPIVKCRVDGTAPVAAAGNVGDVLGVGDCIRYDIGAATVPQCISDAAGTNVTSFECG